MDRLEDNNTILPPMQSVHRFFVHVNWIVNWDQVGYISGVLGGVKGTAQLLC